jgi:hypothetical protein
MVPEFKIVLEGPENEFLGPRMCLPDEETLAREFEAARKLERGDVKVEYSVKDGRRQVLVYGRVVRMIDCTKRSSWIADAEECLKTNRGFDILNATSTDISELDRIVRPYADWFHWSDSSEPTPRRKVRPIK